MQNLQDAIQQAAAAIKGADALLVTAGAGMGVDSGMPDFRGPEGFWKAYPPFKNLGLDFVAMANPRWFHKDPEMAWGFYGHRLNLYRDTAPHAGFGILQSWALRMPEGGHVFTSNVDGHFQRGGFDEDIVTEVHGSILFAQCMKECGAGIFPADEFQIGIDESTFRCAQPLPVCPHCGGLARPNVLMFGDGSWDPARTVQQEMRLENWLDNVYGKLVVIELGAGCAVPTVRAFSETVCENRPSTLIRINVREAEGPKGCIELPLGALQALRALSAAVG